MQLGPEDTRRFAALTTRLQGQRIAVSQGDEVLSAPIVMAPFTAGNVAITSGGGGPREAVEAPLRQLPGR